MGSGQGGTVTQAQLVRTWAKSQGFEVGVRGRIAPAIWQAYANAHDGFAREAPAGTAHCDCGRQWTGLREAHCSVCHRHFSTPRNFDAHRQYASKKTREHVICVDPLTVTLDGGYPMKIVDTVWGPIYVVAKDHYMTDDENGLYDDGE